MGHACASSGPAETATNQSPTNRAVTRLHSVRFIRLNIGWRPAPVTYEVRDEAAIIAEAAYDPGRFTPLRTVNGRPSGHDGDWVLGTGDWGLTARTAADGCGLRLLAARCCQYRPVGYTVAIDSPLVRRRPRCPLRRLAIILARRPFIASLSALPARFVLPFAWDNCSENSDDSLQHLETLLHDVVA